MSSRPFLRIANCSGFYGDRLSAAREMIEGGDIDVLTGDYLAELTMFLLWKSSQRPNGVGYARTFIEQAEHVLGTCAERGVRVVTNAGGLDPAAAAREVRALAMRLGIALRVAHIEGDDVVARLDGLRHAGEELVHLDSGKPFGSMPGTPVTANVYLGGWGIAEALRGGADIVVCPRVTDASLVVGPACWHFGWAPDDWDALAGAVVTGHILECGAQATGGNFSFFTELSGLEDPGFPIAEVRSDGTSVITKHHDRGGAVTVETVTAQLLYEIDRAAYVGPDVVAHFDTIRLEQEADDRVLVSGTIGSPPPRTLKVAVNYSGGFRNRVGFAITGLEIDAKAELASRTFAQRVGGPEQFDAFAVSLVRSEDPDVPEGALDAATLTITAQSKDRRLVGRAFSNVAAEMALASYPGLYLVAPPGDATEFGVYWPTCVAAEHVAQYVVHDDGVRVPVEDRTPRANRDAEDHDQDVGPAPTPAADEPVVQRPLGVLAGARSGDKGGNANVGVWATSADAYALLDRELTVDRFRALLPETAAFEIRRTRLPNLLALNFVVVGLLGEGAAANLRCDTQAKSLGERLRARTLSIPARLTQS